VFCLLSSNTARQLSACSKLTQLEFTRAVATVIVSRRVCGSVCLSVCPHFGNTTSPAVVVGISEYLNTNN